MKLYDLIFSDRPPVRVKRHFVFWVAFVVYFYYVNFLPARPEDLSDRQTYIAALRLMIYLPISAVSVYTSLYFLLPRYILRERYLALVFGGLALLIICFALACGLTRLLAAWTAHLPFAALPVSFRWFQPVRYGIGLPLTSAVFTTIIKLAKGWHEKQKENEGLLRRRIANERELLKTQFNPQFLLQCLYQIRRLVDSGSPDSPSTLMKVSELLSYTLYHSEKEDVPLKQELAMVKTYLSLHKTFYPESLRITLNQQLDNDRLRIAPLLLISVAEESLQYLLGQQPTSLPVTVTAKADGDELYFQFESTANRPPAQIFPGQKRNAWLRRMELQYPGRFSCENYSENGTTGFCLVVQLRQWAGGIKKENVVPA